MKNIISILVLFIIPFKATLAQDFWSFPSPKINASDCKITDTIYMAITGNDTNDGSMDSPVASFRKAMELLPFGQSGVNDGNAYGLIRMLPGEYILESGFVQNENNFKQNNTYKNISIEGMGKVILRGRKEQFATGHMVKLIGSHIFIKNLEIKYATIHGILLAADHQISDVLIENVITDSVQSFGILIRNAKNIKVDNCKVLHSSRPENESLTTPCSWPSGLKFYGCENAVCQNTEVAYTRGEGLNFHNTSIGLAFNNKLHDNPTNLYCDNSQKIIIRQNLIYSNEGEEKNWLTCPGDTNNRNGSRGILLANEGACEGGLGPTYNNCTTICPLGGNYPHIDSIFIHNNIFINTAPALSLWQGVTEILGGPNCLKNIYFEHNTIAGVIGGYEDSRPHFFSAFFPNAYNTITGLGYATVENCNIRNNIFALPKDQYPKATLSRVTRHNLFPVPFDLKFKNNAVNIADAIVDSDNFEVTFKKTSINSNIDSIKKYFEPCENLNPELIHSASLKDWINNDFFSNLRNSENNNIGAMIKSQNCETNTTQSKHNQNYQFVVYPNPVNEYINITDGLNSGAQINVEIFDQTGKVLHHSSFIGDTTLHLSYFPNGIYFLKLNTKNGTKTFRLVKIDN
jgi:hypothetical protein